MVHILDRICAGQGTLADLDLLEELAAAMTDGSLCGLGKSAANPVISTLKYFREEYEAHVVDGRCPGKVCKALFTMKIDPEKCTGCVVCAASCPEEGAITGEKKGVHTIHPEHCTRCGICFDVCKFDAVYKE